MALAGHDTVYPIFNSTANSTSYSGSLTVADGELIEVEFTGVGDTGTNDTTAWTVTLNGSPMTRRSGTTSGVGVVGVAGIFTAIASGSGAQTVALTTGNGCRGMAANGRRLTGYDPTTPVPNAGQGDSFGSNVTALTVPNGITTGADGNAVLGCIGINGGDVTGLAATGVDGVSTGQTGGNQFTDAEWGNAHKLMPTAGSVSFAWTWTLGRRPAAAWIEVAAAAGAGSQTVTGASFTDADTFHGGVLAAAFVIAGATFADGDTFHGGVISQGAVISGADFADPDTFHGGSLTTTSAIDGATFADADTFHGGVISQGLIIVGDHFPAATWGGGAGTWGGLPADWGGDLFPLGSVSASYAVVGAAFSDADAFHGGQIGQGFIISGAAFADGDIFHGGSFGTAYTVTGAAFSDTDVFHGGTIGQGAFVVGGAFADGDLFHGGSISAAYDISSTQFAETDIFHGGALTTAYTIAGAVLIDADAFHGGVLGDQPVITFIILASHNPPGFRAPGGQGSFRAIGGGN